MSASVQGQFYGFHSTLTKGNLYLFFVTDEGFHLARVGDRMPSQQGAMAFHFGLAGILIHQFVTKPAIKKRLALEARYSELGPGTSEFSSLDARNRTIKAEQVASASLKPVTFLGKDGQRAGTLQLKMQDGQEMKLELSSSELVPAQIERLVRIVLPQAQGSLT